MVGGPKMQIQHDYGLLWALWLAAGRGFHRLRQLHILDEREVNMQNPGRRIVVILLLTLAAAGSVSAQLKPATYQAGQLAAVATETVVVDRFGITPQTLTRHPGPFLLCVRDRRGNSTEHFSLTLDSPSALGLVSLDTSPRKFHGAILVDLLPGKYRLRLINSPNLSVAIAIQ